MTFLCWKMFEPVRDVHRKPTKMLHSQVVIHTIFLPFICHDFNNHPIQSLANWSCFFPITATAEAAFTTLFLPPRSICETMRRLNDLT